MKRKGFTLIELLAVIVVLAIIALIATPIILNIIEKARIGSAESSVLGYSDAVEKTIIKEMTKGGTIDDGEYSTDDGSDLISKITYKGTRVIGEFTLVKKQMVSGQFCVDNYPIDYDGKRAKYNKSANYCNGVNLSDSTPVEPLIGETIGNITQTLLENNTAYGNYTYMGEHSLYLKGVQENNYLWYNGFLWRIMGKNEDGTIRLITEGTISTVAWGALGEGDWNRTGYLKDWLNNYFYSNLDSSKINIIVDSDWCINTTTSNTSARTDCTGGSLVESKVGLISLDEYNLSGASSTNDTYGLVNSQDFWTLTPYNEGNAVWYAKIYGGISISSVDYFVGVRPVINVDEDAIVTSGDGSLENAHILNQTLSDKTGLLNKKSTSGEYVKLNDYVYRIVSKNEDGTTKLFFEGRYDINQLYLYNGNFDSTIYNATTGENTFQTSSGIGEKLNNDVLNGLGNSDKIITSNWYQTSGFSSGTAYTTILNDTTNPIESKVGLIRIGEMLSGQSASLLTRHYTERSDYSNTGSYWTMNKYTETTHIGVIDNTGSAVFRNISNNAEIKPVIVVGTSTTISAGNGTLMSPYIIN